MDESFVMEFAENDLSLTMSTNDELVIGGAGSLQYKSVTVIENGTTNVYPDEEYDGLSRVNIVTNVPQPSGNINITDLQSHDVSQYATAQVVDADIVASNIKKDVNILGVVGTLESSREYSHCHYDYPSNFPNLDNVDLSQYSYHYFGIMAKTDMIDDFIVNYDLYVCKVENNQLVVLHTFYADRSSNHCTISKSVIDSLSGDVFVLCQVNNGRYKSGEYNAFDSACIPIVYFYNIALSSASANYRGDMNGLETTYMEYVKFKNCTITNVYSSCGSEAIQKIEFENCTIQGEFRYYLNSTTMKELVYTNCTFNFTVGTSWYANFNSAYALETIDLSMIDFSSYTSAPKACLSGCTRLRNFSGANFPLSFNLSTNYLLTHQSLLNVIDKLPTVSTAQTLTLGSTNLAKLSDAEKQVAVNKGWTLA